MMWEAKVSNTPWNNTNRLKLRRHCSRYEIAYFFLETKFDELVAEESSWFLLCVFLNYGRSSSNYEMQSLKCLFLFLIWAEESMVWNGNKVNNLFNLLITVWIFEYFNLLNSVCIRHRYYCCPCFAGVVIGGTKFHKVSKWENQAFRRVVCGWSPFQLDHMVGWEVCRGDSYLIKPIAAKMINTGEKQRDVLLSASLVLESYRAWPCLSSFW